MHKVKLDQLPKKLFRIESLSFILPDDFDGTVHNALDLLTEYITLESEGDPHLLESHDPKKSIIEMKKNANRLSMEYGIFELDEHGNYVLK